MTKIFTLTKRNTFVATAVCAFAYLLLAQSAVIARNAIDQQSETAKKTPAGESKFATLDGARIRYVNYGKGSDAIVLIHGWTQSIDAWHDQIPDLVQRGRVIALDLPAMDKATSPKRSTTTWTISLGPLML